MPLLVFSSKLNDAESKNGSVEQKQQAQTLKTALENVGRFTIAKQVGEGDAILEPSPTEKLQL